MKQEEKLKNDSGIGVEDAVLLMSVQIIHSRGRRTNGKMKWFLLPQPFALQSASNYTMNNRARAITGLSSDEMYDKAIAAIKKHFHPLSAYRVNNKLIYSNSEENALAEYWRIC